MALLHHQIDDFIEATLNDIPHKKYTDISQELQHYTFARRWFKNKKRPRKGGPRMEFKLRTADQGNAKDSGLYAVDDTSRVNVLTNGKQEWSKQTVNYTYDIDEEEFQADALTLIDMMEVHEQGLYNDFYKHMEIRTWTAPSSSSLDPMPPSGIPFWVQKNSTAAFGFNGADPAGWASGAATIATAIYAGWKNPTFTYAQVSHEDAIEKIINGMDFCYFEAPRSFPDLVGGEPDWGIYTVYSVLQELRKMAMRQNDNMGSEVASHSDTVTIRGTPVIWVPALTHSSSDAYDYQRPIYGINWRTMHYYFKKGRSMIKNKPYQAANQSSVRVRVMNNWGNFMCEDRRANFVGYDSTAVA